MNKPTLKTYLKDCCHNVRKSDKDGRPVLDKAPHKSKKRGYPHGTRKGDGGLAESVTLRREEEEDLEGGLEGAPNDDMPQDGQDLNQDQAQEVVDDSMDSEQMTIRTVAGAHLVYKRPDDEGQFEELWIFNIDDDSSNKRKMKHMDVKKAILAGTDIPVDKMSSEDGTQRYEMWTAGNAQMIHISGLPN